MFGIMTIAMLAFTHTYKVKIKKTSSLGLDCVGNVLITTWNKKYLSWEINAPDSISYKFHVEKGEDNYVHCVVENIHEQTDLKSDLKDLRHNIFSDSVFITYKIPQSTLLEMVSVNAGFLKGTMLFNKFNIKEMELNVGAGSFKFIVSHPNKVPMDSFLLSEGMAKGEIHGLGNLRARACNIGIGVGKLVVYADGNWKKTAELSINSGAAIIVIKVPDNINCCMGNTNGALNFEDIKACHCGKNADFKINFSGALTGLKIEPYDENPE